MLSLIMEILLETLHMVSLVSGQGIFEPAFDRTEK